VLVLILGMTPPAFAEGSVPVRDGRGAVAPRPERKIVGYATPRPISSADRARYAAREAASPGAKRYQGGGAVIIISASALAVILLVVLLIVLL
jgi:hypothetical protein